MKPFFSFACFASAPFVVASMSVAACATNAVDLGPTDDASIVGNDAGKDGFVPFKDAALADTNNGADTSPADDGGDSGSTPDSGSNADSGGVAVVQINEVNPNITGSVDLIELRVTTGGDTTGITIEENIMGKTLLATLPSITVSAGDFIVVHLTPAAGVKNESATKTDCADAACYPGAWDVRGLVVGLTYSGRVLVARDPKANIQDGVAFYKKGTVSPVNFHTDVTSLQTAKAWLPADCGGNVCSTNALAEAISANWNGCGPLASGASVARAANADTDKAADWVVGPQSFGVTNP